ncbi:hypothetical protein JXA84_06190 [candidate division WOR-3 bacterium]|nr:hypothetical protein [candidate division WOR-3 bacterium]
MKAFISFVLLSLAVSSLWSGESIVRITLHSDDVRAECRAIDIVPERVVGPRSVEVVLTEKMIEEVREKGYEVEIVVEDYSKYLQDIFSHPDWAQYHNHAQTVAMVESLAGANPNIVKVETLGYSVQNRVIQVMKITDNPLTDEFEPEIRFDANHHGDETPTVEVCLWLAYRLCQGYGTNPYLTSLVDNREIWIIPMMNPDGRTNLMRYNANGVDLNRDYGYMWDREGSSSYPFSQPESRALGNLMNARNFTTAASYHTGTIQISQAWSYHYDPPKDNANYNNIWGYYSTITGYPHGQGSHAMYYINGPTKDYDYGVSGCIGSTVEVCYIKNPSANSIEVICNREDSAMFVLIKKAGQGIAGIVTDSITGDPLWATIKVVEIGWPYYTDKNFGDYHRYVMPGTYSIKVESPGYRPKTVTGITTYTDTFTRVDVQLSPWDSSYAFQVPICNVPNYNDQNHTLTIDALGAPDGLYLSLGVKQTSNQRQGWAVLDMGPQTCIKNRPGPDMKIFEGNDGTVEACSVYVGENATWTGPWYFVGMSNGTSEIDITSSGLTEARYVLLVDDGNSSYTGSTPGYDLDAVQAYALPQNAAIVLSGYSFNPTCPMPGDTVITDLEVLNAGLSTGYNIDIELVSLTSGVTTIDSLRHLDSLASGAAGAANGFSFYISPSLPMGTLVDLEATISLSSVVNSVDTISFLSGFQVFIDSVENGQGNWTHSGTNDQWHITEFRSHTPTHSWYCGNSTSHVYSSNVNASLVTQDLLIGLDCVFKFWERYNTESNWDTVLVEYTVNGTTWNNLSARFGVDTVWHETTYDLDNIPAGTTVKFRFRFHSDGSIEREGWFVDDIRMYNPLGVEEEVVLGPYLTRISIMPSSFFNRGTAVFYVSGVGPDRPGELTVFDVSGRVIRTETITRSGTVELPLTDRKGLALPQASYFAILKSGQSHSACKFTVY